MKTKKVKKIENQFIYYYYYEEEKLILVEVFEKKRIFKKFYGDYIFVYQDNRLVQQTSRLYQEGLFYESERILYFYDDFQRLVAKEYYNEKNQLRYRVSFLYQQEKDSKPLEMQVVRMEQFPFFKTRNPLTIEKNKAVVGKDFEGSFFLLETIEQEGLGNA